MSWAIQWPSAKVRFLLTLFFRKHLPTPQEVLTEKIISKLNVIKNLTIILQAIFTLETLLRSLPMALDPAVQAALDAAKQKIADAITKEVQDVKDLVNSGASTTEIVAALDDLGTSVASSIDTISTDASTPSTQ